MERRREADGQTKSRRQQSLPAYEHENIARLRAIAMRTPISCVRWPTECATTVYRPIEASSSAIAAKIRNGHPLATSKA